MSVRAWVNDGQTIFRGLKSGSKNPWRLCIVYEVLIKGKRNKFSKIDDSIQALVDSALPASRTPCTTKATYKERKRCIGKDLAKLVSAEPSIVLPLNEYTSHCWARRWSCVVSRAWTRPTPASKKWMSKIKPRLRNYSPERTQSGTSWAKQLKAEPKRSFWAWTRNCARQRPRVAKKELTTAEERICCRMLNDWCPLNELSETIRLQVLIRPNVFLRADIQHDAGCFWLNQSVLEKHQQRTALKNRNLPSAQHSNASGAKNPSAAGFKVARFVQTLESKAVRKYQKQPWERPYEQPDDFSMTCIWCAWALICVTIAKSL